MKETTLVFLLNNQNQILLGMKKRGHGIGKRNGFGGKRSGEETIIDAAVRELQEESDIKIQSNDIQQIGIVTFMFLEQPELSQKCSVFKGNYNGLFKETEEMAPQLWDIDKIPYDHMRESDKVRLSKLLKGESFDIVFTIDKNGKTIQQ